MLPLHTTTKKTAITFLIVFCVSISSSFLLPNNVSADTPPPCETPPCVYHPLVNLPQVTQPTAAEGTNFTNYASGWVKLLIGAAAVLAVIMIVIGGIQYMSTDAIMGKSDAKARIEYALWGLLLAIICWLILYTINPGILNFNLNAPKNTVSNPPPPAQNKICYTNGATVCKGPYLSYSGASAASLADCRASCGSGGICKLETVDIVNCPNAWTVPGYYALARCYMPNDGQSCATTRDAQICINQTPPGVCGIDLR